MNLIEAYLENQNSRINYAPVFSSNQSGAWELFHNSLSKTVAVFAGRDTGKTHNIALRALQSPNDSLILVYSSISFAMMRGILMRLDLGNPMRLSSSMQGGNYLCLTYMSGKEIKVRTMNSFMIEGESFKNMDIYIEEPELMNEDNLRNLIDLMNVELKYNKILLVGSITSEWDTVAKRFFATSETKCFIDNNEEELSSQGLIQHSLTPSILADYLSELPSFL